MVEIKHFGGFGWKMVTGRKHSFQIADLVPKLGFSLMGVIAFVIVFSLADK